MEKRHPHMDGSPMPPMEIPCCPRELLDQITVKYLDLPYGSASEDQKVDIYLPENADGPVPVICWFHGGGFQMGFKRDGQLCDLLPVLSQGYALVSVGYRKSGEARFPAMVYDAKAAIRFVRANGGQYGLDASRIAVWGGSSGGWLASFVAATNGMSAFEDRRMANADISSDVQALIDWCGPCGDFSALAQEKKSGLGGPSVSPEDAFMGAPVGTVPELCHLASPASHVSDKMPPTMIVHGEKDFVVPLSQSKAFYDAVVSAAGPERTKLYVHPNGGHHGDTWYHEPWLVNLCLDFLNQHLK